MFLKINNRIINTAHIIEAKLTGEGTKAVLVLHTIDDGNRNIDAGTAVVFHGQEAQAVWNALSGEARTV